MVRQEGSLIEKVQIEVPANVSKGGPPFPYPKEWVLWYLGSSNHKSANTDIFKDVYFLCRDLVVPNMSAYELF